MNEADLMRDKSTTCDCNSSDFLFHSNAKRLHMIHANMKRSRGISHSKEDRQRFSLVSIYNYNFHVELSIYELIISLKYTTHWETQFKYTTINSIWCKRSKFDLLLVIEYSIMIRFASPLGGGGEGVRPPPIRENKRCHSGKGLMGVRCRLTVWNEPSIHVLYMKITFLS